MYYLTEKKLWNKVVKEVAQTKQKMPHCTLHLNLDFCPFNIPSVNLLRHIWATFFFWKWGGSECE